MSKGEQVTTAIADKVKVGTIFYGSWGYDQTNVDFYKVIRITASGKSVEVVPIGTTVVEAHGPGGNRVMPNPDVVLDRDTITGIGGYIWTKDGERIPNPKKSKVCRLGTGYQGEPTIVLEPGRHWGWLYKGGTLHETDSMFGH